MAGFRVRAITLHYGKPLHEADAEDLAFRLLEAKDRVSSLFGVGVESVRITFAPAGGGFRGALEAAEDLEPGDLEGVFVNLGGYRLSGEEDVEAVVDLVERGFFVSILYGGGGWSEARLASEAFHKAASRSPDYPVHMGFNPLGDGLLTPYYPLSHAREGETIVTVALLYPNHLREAFRRDGLEGVVEAMVEAGKLALSAGREAASLLGAEGYAVDLSISPWMEETVLGLVEEIAGVRLPDPGFAWGLYMLNKAIERAASKLGPGRVTGFNEVQLPVAEDLKLKLRAAEGDTRARDLLRLAGVCLAGLDMVVLPASRDGVAGLLLEAEAYSRVKGRVVGVRVIPVEEVEPGDKVYLKRFGEVPVIPL
ncbi:MAG: DUF711 family protein [Desulfurococcales archaeon]|nr:DUF711 family protein [Desulfurococcales archaeon]